MQTNLSGLQVNQEHIERGLEFIKVQGSTSQSMMKDIKKYVEEFANDMKFSIDKLEKDNHQQKQKEEPKQTGIDEKQN